VTRRALRQVLRYFKDFERADYVFIDDVAPESEYLYDESGKNIVGCNILFSCSFSNKKKKGATDGK